MTYNERNMGVKSLKRDNGILSCPGTCLNAGPDSNILNV